MATLGEAHRPIEATMLRFVASEAVCFVSMHQSNGQWGFRCDGHSRQMAGRTHQVRIRSKHEPRLAARNGPQAVGGRVPFGQFRHQSCFPSGRAYSRNRTRALKTGFRAPMHA